MNKTPTMSRKDFQLIARVIASARGLDKLSRLELAEQFAEELHDTNPLFNHVKFIEACANDLDKE